MALSLQQKEIINKQFLFRNIRQEETAEAAQIEQICFPPNEACKPEQIARRVQTAPELFLVAQDRENGIIAGFLNGISTNEHIFRDEFFTDESLYDPDGTDVMLLGLDVRPEYRRRGLATAIMEEYKDRMRKQGRKRLVLTCLDNKVAMYKGMGFTDLGVSGSIWGGEQWHDMDFVL